MGAYKLKNKRVENMYEFMNMIGVCTNNEEVLVLSLSYLNKILRVRTFDTPNVLRVV